MKKLLTTLLISMLFIAVCGCEESSTSSSQRAAMIETENLRVELSKKDAKITELEKQLVDCKKKNAEIGSKTVSTGQQMMSIFASASKRAAELEKENANLKARIKELEGKE